MTAFCWNAATDLKETSKDRATDLRSRTEIAQYIQGSPSVSGICTQTRTLDDLPAANAPEGFHCTSSHWQLATDGPLTCRYNLSALLCPSLLGEALPPAGPTVVREDVLCIHTGRQISPALTPGQIFQPDQQDLIGLLICLLANSCADAHASADARRLSESNLLTGRQWPRAGNCNLAGSSLPPGGKLSSQVQDESRSGHSLDSLASALTLKDAGAPLTLVSRTSHV